MLRKRPIELNPAWFAAVLFVLCLSIAATSLSARPRASDTLTKDGFGNLHIGMPFRAIKALYGRGLSVDKDQDVSGQCFFGILVERRSIQLMFIKDVLARIDVHGDLEHRISTTRGIAVGDKASDVERAFQNQFTKIASDGPGYTILVQDRTRRRGLAFYVEGQHVTWIYAGEMSALKRLEDCL